MTLRVNGEDRSFASGSTLSDLLRALGVRSESAATEVNGVVVPRAAWGTTRLSEGDRVEIVTLTGGG